MDVTSRTQIGRRALGVGRTWRHTALMSDVMRHQGSVEALARGFPVCRILYGIALVCVLLLGLLAAPGAQAGALYRCVGSRGEIAYSSSTAGYHECRKVSSFATPSPQSRTASRTSARVTLTRVTAAVATTGRNLGADGAQPATLARVAGMVQTNARPLAIASVQRTSLAAAHGTVLTAAEPATLVPGQWNYQQSIAGTAPPPRAVAANGSAAAPGDRPRVLQGAVYRVVRADGSVEYTNLRPSTGVKGHAVTMLFSYIATCVACDLRSPIRWGSVALNLTAYADSIRSASIEYGVDEAFLRAIIHAESAFNPRALSIKGAQGLMQLMPGTANDMGVLDAFNTEQNIRGGARYLALMLHNFGGNEQMATAAYNAGPGAVQRYNGVPPYAETLVYVQRVGTLRKRYGAAIHPPLAAQTTRLATARM